MQVTMEERGPCEVELNIEVAADKVSQTIDDVYREFGRTTQVPGFRKGKAPRPILERYVSDESVRRRAVDLMVPSAYQEAVKEHDIHPYADPDVEIVQLDTEQPFVFKAKIPLPPKVEVGDYRGITVERPKVEVTDDDVEAQLKYLQEGRAKSEKVESRGVQTGDIVVADIASAFEGEDLGEPRRSLVQVGSNVPGFDENIAGMEPGQRRTFQIEYPADFDDKELAGKNVNFDVTVDSMRERLVPDLNDDFARTLGDFETLNDLKEDLRKRLLASAEESADREVERRILDEIVSRSEVCFPNVLVEHDMGHDLEDLQDRLGRQGVTIEQYLQQIGKTQEAFTAETREAAERRIRNGLVLGRIAEAQNVDVTDDDVNAEIDRMAEESKATRESVEAYIEAQGGRSILGNSLLNKRLMDFLKSVSTIK